MITILAYCPGPKDPTSFYRGMMPLMEIQNKFHGYRIVEGDLMRTSWHHIAQADVVFLQRPHSPALRQVAEIAKEMGRPIWVDLDDDHLNVPLHYDTSKLYNDLDNRQAHVDILALADILSVSTAQLVDNYRNYCQNIHHIPNALPDFLFDWQPEFNNTVKRPHILWRGSDKHSLDLAMFLPQINAIIESGADITFFGYRPEVKEADNVHFVEHTSVGDMLGYFRKLANLQPDLVICPLASNDFNKCKSNNAMWEAFWIGADCIAPDLPEWKNPIDETHNYKDADQFLQKVLRWITGQTWNEISNSVAQKHRAIPKLNNTNGMRLDLLNIIVPHKLD